MRKPAELPEITPYPSQVLADLMFDEGSETYEVIMDGILEAAEVARIAIEDNPAKGPDDLWELERAYQTQEKFLPGQLLYFLPEARALPEHDLTQEEVEAFFVELLKSHNEHYQRRLIQEGGLKRTDEGLYVDLDFTLGIILGFATTARFNHINHNRESSSELVYFPPVKATNMADATKKIQDTLSDAIEKTLLTPENLAVFKQHPDWLLIVPQKMLKKAFLESHPEFADALLEALGAAIFMRICAQLCFDEILTTRPYMPLWTLYFKKKKAAINDDNPALLEAIQTIWAYEGKGLPRSLDRMINVKRVRIEAADVQANVAPIIEASETVEYFEPQEINTRLKNGHIDISTKPWPQGAFLHLVVRGVARSKKTQNTTIYCFDSWEQLQRAIIHKPENYSFSVAGFICDSKTAFPNANTMSGIDESHWCTVNKISDPEPIVASTTDASPASQQQGTNLPTDLRTPLKRCTPCEEALILANELDWQIHLAENLIEYLDEFEKIFEAITWNERLISFTPRTKTESVNCLEPFTIDADTLTIVNPVLKAKSQDLDTEILSFLVSWAEAKKDQQVQEEQNLAEQEQTKKHRKEVSDWRQADDSRKIKGQACREAIGFRPWEDYQQGTHKGPNGLELALYAWDKTCVSRDFLPKLNHLLGQLAQAGVKVSYEKALLQSGRQRDVILDALAFKIPDANLEFQLRINREAESPSEIFSLEFDDAVPDPWRNEAARWAIGTVCMMGIITLPKDKSPLNAGKQSRPNNSGHFTFKVDRKRAKQSRESKSSYLNLVHRLNEKRGRIKAVASGGCGFEWDGSWADFADAGFSVYQNAFFKAEPKRDPAESKADYELILKDERWQKYAILRLWKTMKQGQKVGDLNHRSSVGPYSEKMAEVAQAAWERMSPEEQAAFSSITSPSEAAQFTFKHGEDKQCNFIRTLISMWQAAEIGLFVRTEPIYVTFDSVLQHCQKEGVEIMARSQEDLDAIEEVGLPDLKIIRNF